MKDAAPGQPATSMTPTAPITPATPVIASRLPDVGTTIFSVMSALAHAHGAVNLGQGFPDFDCHPALIDAVHQAMRQGCNQYPPMPGLPALRQAVSAKIAALYGKTYDPETEVTVTAGATQALLTAIMASVQPGDEAIVLEPCYDSYVPAITLAGAKAVRVALTPGTFRPDFERIASAITPRTRLLMLNTPHNPSGVVWSRDEMLQLQALLEGTPVIVISDEVYEHMVFDGARHHSASGFEGLAARSFVVSSFGKTFHVTGWKVGTVAAPAALMGEFRKIHQFNVFTVSTPMQMGLATWLQNPQPYLELPAFYQAKRDFFRAGLAQTRFKLLPCEGTYFQSVDISALTDQSEAQYCEWLTREAGVAAIPTSAFYGDGFDQGIIRFCFAKQQSTLELALQRLQRL